LKLNDVAFLLYCSRIKFLNIWLGLPRRLWRCNDYFTGCSFVILPKLLHYGLRPDHAVIFLWVTWIDWAYAILDPMCWLLLLILAISCYCEFVMSLGLKFHYRSCKIV
jgi:hypothetical protein